LNAALAELRRFLASFMKHLFIFSLALCLATIAAAGETETASPTPAPRFKISGWIDSGITFNPASPQEIRTSGGSLTTARTNRC